MNLIIGRKPVLEAINSGEDIEQVYLLYGQKGGIVDAIRIAAKKRGIKCTEIPSQRFNSLISHPNAQGVAAKKTLQKFYSLDEIIKYSKSKSLPATPSQREETFKAPPIIKEKGAGFPLLLILDSIQDTHNLGAIIRTADCSGVDGIIITKHNSAPVNETVVKTSAGATEHAKICQVNNLAQAMQEIKINGFWIAGSSLENSRGYTEVDYKIPLALVVGNEEKGIRRLTAEKCDILVKIPMVGKIQSLNVSVATGILLFEILRQRKA